MTTTSSASTRTTMRPATPDGPRPTRGTAARPTHLRLVTGGTAGRPVERAGASSVGVPRRPEPPVRLTRRGRAVLRGLVVLAMLALMAGAALTMAHRAAADDGPTRPVAVVHHVVLPGETLWAIATELAPSADPRDTVARIVEFNALASSAVQAGQDLAIPPDLPGRG